MNKYYRYKRLRQTVWVLLAAVLVVGVLGYFIFLALGSPPQQPTLEPSPSPSSTATMILPSGTPLPPPEDWDLSRDLEVWQQQKVIADLALFWNVFMAPDGGTPNCHAASDLMWSGNPSTKEIVAKACDTYMEQGFYYPALPLTLLETKFFLFPEDGSLVVRLDTRTDWPREKRYMSDNQLAGTQNVPRTIYDVSMAIEKGRWTVAAIHLYEEPIP